MAFNPFLAFLTTHSYLLCGRLHFPREHIGQVLAMDDGQEFTIFRQVVVDPAPHQPEKPGAQFRVQFQLAGMSPEANKWFSWFPVPFFVGLPGFRSKRWMVNEATGVCQGLYEWDTVQDAENYAHSFAMRFMTQRSVPGSIACQIIPVVEA